MKIHKIKPVTITMEITDFANLVRVAQALSGLTQSEMAQHFTTGTKDETVHQITIHNWVNGKGTHRPHNFEGHVDSAIDILRDTPGVQVNSIGNYGPSEFSPSVESVAFQ
jgi:hypothetical protein